ncbi:hypothetical protein EEL31_23885 [Brevibacillus laterosporus]|nr:hypothetical protein [Brevibacillus laterosporus]TPG71172.1 hypothetical protein EEL31_23885 [Brevibacillus laterosporus]
MHELYLIKRNKQQINITDLSGNISWESNVDTLGVRLEFEIAYNDTRFFPRNPVEIGDSIVLTNQGKIVYQGFIVDDGREGRGKRSYISFDSAFYLNESKVTVQFRNTPAKKAIEQLIKPFKIPIGKIDISNEKITKIYNNKKVSEVIKDILTYALLKSNNTYRMEIQEGKFFILNQESLVINPLIQLTKNSGRFPILDTIKDPVRKISITKLKNSIQVVHDDKVIYTLHENNSINKFGLLQESLSVDKDEVKKGTYKQMANILLGKLNVISEENSLTLLGNDEIRSGRLIYISEETTGMDNLYLIKTAVHSLESGIHTVKLGLLPKP